MADWWRNVDPRISAMSLCVRRRQCGRNRASALSPLPWTPTRVGWRLLAGLRARAACLLAACCLPKPSVSLEIASERNWMEVAHHEFWNSHGVIIFVLFHLYSGFFSLSYKQFFVAPNLSKRCSSFMEHWNTGCLLIKPFLGRNISSIPENKTHKIYQIWKSLNFF